MVTEVFHYLLWIKNMKPLFLVLLITLVFKSMLVAQLTDNSKREGDLADPAINPIYDYY